MFGFAIANRVFPLLRGLARVHSPTRFLKRNLPVAMLAVALSVFGPVTSSFFALPAGLHAPAAGGTLIVRKNGEIPSWIADAIGRNRD